MSPGEYERMRTVEDHHWWYQVLRWLASDALTKTTPKGQRVLDAGCGTGGMLDIIHDHVSFGIDLSETAVRICRQRGPLNVQVANIEQLPFPNHHFDAVLCLDVLYHNQVDPMTALTEIRRVLKPCGHLILNLPAFDSLRGAHDIAVSGARRYRASGLTHLLHEQGFKVVQMHYWNAWSFVPLWIWRRWSRTVAVPNPPSDLTMLPDWLNAALASMGRMDARLCRTLRLPFGSSVFALACSG